MPAQTGTLIIRDFLTISEAAGSLGVSAATLCYWDQAWKLKPARHPLSGYWLHCREDLDAILGRILTTAVDEQRGML